MDILIVDDNKLMREMVSAMVQESGHQPVTASGFESAIIILEQQPIDLMLMDIEMPDMNGFELTKLIRQKYKHWFPIIFLSSNSSEGYLAQGIDAGGDDYLTKPVKQVILSAKIKAMERIADMQKALDSANQQLAKLTNIDPLTQVANRRGMDKFIEHAWEINSRQSGELSLLMIDIDHFKLYNDNYGHQQGDDCLTQVAQVLAESLNRATDGVFRYGGEEFIIILPFTPIEGARYKAKEIFSKLDKCSLLHEFSPSSEKVTVSVGISSTSLLANSYSDLISQADKALYLAKEQGRNREVVFE